MDTARHIVGCTHIASHYTTCIFFFLLYVRAPNTRSPMGSVWFPSPPYIFIYISSLGFHPHLIFVGKNSYKFASSIYIYIYIYNFFFSSPPPSSTHWGCCLVREEEKKGAIPSNRHVSRRFASHYIRMHKKERREQHHRAATSWYNIPAVMMGIFVSHIYTHVRSS